MRSGVTYQFLIMVFTNKENYKSEQKENNIYKWNYRIGQSVSCANSTVFYPKSDPAVYWCRDIGNQFNSDIGYIHAVTF